MHAATDNSSDRLASERRSGSVHVRVVTDTCVAEARAEAFVSNHADGCLFHLPRWAELVRRCYGHDVYYLIATTDAPSDTARMASGEIVGFVPFVHVSHWLLGNSLVSMPFCDSGGILGVDADVERALAAKSVELAHELRARWIELRHHRALSVADDVGAMYQVPGWRVTRAPGANKVRMLLQLPSNPDALFDSFKAKLRSQIKRPLKEGLSVRMGGTELVDDFYRVFAENMRDLGSPVHSRGLIAGCLQQFPGGAELFVVYGRGQPLAGAMTIGFKDVMVNPWASSLRRYSALAPNMLLYWSMLERACRRGHRTFDFGRSTPDEGTFRFKQQWGAQPVPLHWYRLAGAGDASADLTAGPRAARAKEFWKRLPVAVTRVLGPRIRRYISL